VVGGGGTLFDTVPTVLDLERTVKLIAHRSCSPFCFEAPVVRAVPPPSKAGTFDDLSFPLDPPSLLLPPRFFVLIFLKSKLLQSFNPPLMRIFLLVHGVEVFFPMLVPAVPLASSLFSLRLSNFHFFCEPPARSFLSKRRPPFVCWVPTNAVDLFSDLRLAQVSSRSFFNPSFRMRVVPVRVLRLFPSSAPPRSTP